MGEVGQSRAIGFIGVGFMGHGMAANLLKAGHRVSIKGNRNRVPVEDLVAKGARECTTPREVAEASDIVHLCLSNSDQVEAVIRGADGILASKKSGLIVIDTTTSDPNSTQSLATDLAAAGMILVDAPLGRTPKEAEEGNLDAMVGADPETFEKVRPVVACWAGNINHVGPVGSAHKMKLVMNFISMGYAALYAEALVMGGKAGLSPQIIHQVIGSSRLANPFYETFMKYAVGRDRDAHKFTIANASKDLRYAANMAVASGTVNTLGAAIRNSFATVDAQGHGADFVPMLTDHMAALNGIDMDKLVSDGES